MPSADAIDVVMAFVRWSGVRPLIDALRRHCEAGKPVRVLTTTYTNSTEQRALDELERLGAEIKVSYDTTSTRLHAKAWIFHRESGYSTAYIGSSNLTHSAQVLGLEWNVRVSAARNPDAVAKMAAVSTSYWESGDFVPYDPEEFRRRTRAVRPMRRLLSPIEIVLRPFQEALLEQIVLARSPGPPSQPARRRYRNREDRDGGGRLRASRSGLAAAGCCSSLTARRSSTRAARRSGTRCATPRSASSGSPGKRRRSSSTSSRRSRA